MSKTARERMDVIAAYETVGTYRGAAEICGTTHRTVKRIVDAHQAQLVGEPAVRKDRVHNYDQVTGLVAAKVATTQGRISAKRLLPAARAAGYAGRRGTFAAWSPTPRRCGGVIIIVVAGRGCGCRVSRC